MVIASATLAPGPRSYPVATILPAIGIETDVVGVDQRDKQAERTVERAGVREKVEHAFAANTGRLSSSARRDLANVASINDVESFLSTAR